MDEKIFLGFIINILGIKAISVSSDESLPQFETECCFEPTLQPMYTSKYIQYLFENMADNTFYEITDYLNTSLILFRFESVAYIVGPYVKNSFSKEDMQKLLASHRIPANIYRSIKLYYEQFPQLSYSMIHGTLMAAMRTFVPNIQDFSYRSLTGFHEAIKNEQLSRESTKTYEKILKQYEFENYFLGKITDGDVQVVEIAFNTLINNYYVNTSKTDFSLYSANSNGFAAIRTLARKAAEKGGANVVLIDEITQESIKRYEYARSQVELENVLREMLIRLTKAVKDAQSTNNYSPAIRAVVNYVNLNYSQAISLSTLARQFKISPEHLSRLFKKELGETLTEYINLLRVEKAAELLRSSDLNIATISAYVGFQDNNYFAKVFRKQYDMTPSSYRRMNIV